QRPSQVLLCKRLARMGQALHPIGPSLDVAGRRVMQPRLLALGELDLHLSGQDESDFVLDGENVVEGAVISFGPDMGTAGSVDKLRGYANPVSVLANAAFQDISHAKLPARLA